MAPTLLCFHLPEEQTAKLRFLCMRLKIRLQTVPPSDWGETLAALCGLEARADAPAPEATFDEPMLVMVLFPAGMGQRFLQGMKQAKLPSVSLKAVLTPTNSQWSPVQLYLELCRERAAVQAGKGNAHENS